MPYEVHLAPRAEKELHKLPRKIALQISSGFELLEMTPRARQVKKLHHDVEVYRLRVGSYRIIYQIMDSKKRVLILKIGHRKDVYEFLRNL